MLPQAEEQTGILKLLTNGAYDLQHVRIMIGNRICQQFRHYFGLASSQKEEDMEAQNLKILNTIRDEYKLLSDGLAELRQHKSIEKFLQDRKGLISTFSELQLVEMFEDALAAEQAAFRNLKVAVRKHPLWYRFGQYIHGFGEVGCAILLSKINIHKAEYASSIWAYCGLDNVVKNNLGEEDGRARSKQQEHLVDREYVDKEGNTKTMRCASHGSWLKSKVLMVIGDGLIRARNDHYYGKAYLNYKHRKTNDINYQGVIRRLETGQVVRVLPDGKIITDIPKYYQRRFGGKTDFTEMTEYTKDRLQKMSRRFMVKIFLADLYEAWKMIVGEVPKNPYFEDKMDLERHTRIIDVDGAMLVCDYKTNRPVNQIPPKKEKPSLSEELNLDDATGRQKRKGKGTRTSRNVQRKSADLDTSAQ